jgi:signal transduction histidine kinase
VVPAVLSGLSAYLNGRFARGNFEWGAVAFSAVIWLGFGVLAPITYVLARRYPLKREAIGRTVAAHLIGALVLCIGWTSLGVLLSLWLVRRPLQEPLLRYYFSWLLTNLPWAVFLYFTVLGCVYAFTYYREARERESQQAQLTAQLAEAKLSALRMQLNPHFLFNSLNAITVLVRDQNTQAAAQMLELLSGILRQVLQGEKRQEVTLDEEVQFLQKYLAIEQVRFSDRLEVRWSIEPRLLNVLVPEFILQPLVENAVRHGVAKRRESGLIEVCASESNGDLLLSVRDNGPGFRPTTQSGVGISNTRARLKTLFGDAGELQMLNGEHGGTAATVRFPLRR